MEYLNTIFKYHQSRYFIFKYRDWYLSTLSIPFNCLSVAKKAWCSGQHCWAD